MTKVLVIGGAGVFGGHLVEGLVASGFTVVIAGRSLERAQRAAARFSNDKSVSAIALDTAALTPADLAATRADIVADAAGPFQEAEPATARAAIAAGIHYVDLADARGFVRAFDQLDAAAKAAGVVALTGCSSTPALSNAALDALTNGWTEIVSVEGAISPGARAPRGQSVMEAILSWLGRPVSVFRQGSWNIGFGWQGLMRRDFGQAGQRLVSLCETPDLDLFVSRFKPRDSAIFLAGLEPGFVHVATWLLALFVRLGVPGRWARPEVLLAMGRPFSRFGTDMGAMRVAAYGRDAEGRAVRSAWRLIAEPGVGPVTPSLPALAAIKAIAIDAIAPGARACVGVVPLEALEAELARHGITTEQDIQRASLFGHAIDPAFDELPAAIRDLHEAPGRSTWRGEAVTEGAEGVAARLIARLFGFPPDGKACPVRVEVITDGRRSLWRRTIGSGSFRSVLSQARPGGQVTERFGPFWFQLTLVASAAGLAYVVRGWRLGPMPLPKLLAPRSQTCESVDVEGRFVFDVHLALPWGSRLVHYRGWLRRDA